MIDRLTPADIRDLHDYALRRYGGLPGEHEPGMIDFMADKPFDGFGEMEFYPGLFMKAAVYMEGFATHQLFCDGNKRTGFMCGKAFLMLNGFMLTVTDNELYDTMLAVANKEMSLDQLRAWLEEKSSSMV